MPFVCPAVLRNQSTFASFPDAEDAGFESVHLSEPIVCISTLRKSNGIAGVVRRHSVI